MYGCQKHFSNIPRTGRPSNFTPNSPLCVREFGNLRQMKRDEPLNGTTWPFLAHRGPPGDSGMFRDNALMFNTLQSNSQRHLLNKTALVKVCQSFVWEPQGRKLFGELINCGRTCLKTRRSHIDRCSVSYGTHQTPGQLLDRWAVAD